jgi:O-phosphoseryl-tRNA synthetase
MTDEEDTKIGSLSEKKGEDVVNYFSGIGHPHPISQGVEEMRRLLLESGFDEIHTSYFVGRGELRDLTGNLYPVFRDSIYHLSWIRPEPLAPSLEVERKLIDRYPEMDRAELWNILDGLDEDTSGEELLFTLQEELGLSVKDSVEVMNIVPGLSGGTPKTGDITLRSFMPTSWLSTLEATYHKDKIPLRLFTTAGAFRREPTQDSNHIETYNILSLAIADEDLTLDKGLAVLRRLFDSLDLGDITFREKSYSFPFYRKESELEIFGGDLELGTCGMVDEKIREPRGVKVPVFIADIGIERVLMFRHGYPDIRELLYPQFFAAWDLTDDEIGTSLRYIRRPQTDYGKEIAQAIHKAYRDSSDGEKLSKKVAWKGILVSSDYGRFLVNTDRARELKIEGKKAEIVLKEAREGAGLCGPGAFNEVWVHEGNILGVPPNMFKAMEEKGAYRSNKTFVKAFSRYAAWKIERSLERGHSLKKVEKIKDLEGINLKLTSKALYYMLSHNKKVDVQGPVFLKFHFKVKDD